MKLAYGTYAMPTVPLDEAIPGLARLGYDGIEICLGPRHLVLEECQGTRRAELRQLLETGRLGVPALFLLGHIYTENDHDHEASLERLREAAGLARDLGMAEPPVLALGFGGPRQEWDGIKDRFVELLADYAEVAEEEDFILAGEAHAGAAVDRSERIIWLLDEINNDRIRLHFDIVHLFLANEPVEQAVQTLVPYTAHTHVTDAIKREDGGFELVLPGRGQLDLTAYVGAMAKAGWEGYITLEVSTMVWSKPQYDPWQAAQECYDRLNEAFGAAGVART